GWTCTYPSGCSEAVDLVAGQSKTGVDFGDHQNEQPPHACGSGVIVPAGSKCPPDPPPPPGNACLKRPVVTWVAGRHISRVAFYLDGRKLKSTKVADWQGHYWVEVDASKLRRGQHELRAQLTFIRASKQKARVLNLRFRRCGP